MVHSGSIGVILNQIELNANQAVDRAKSFFLRPRMVGQARPSPYLAAVKFDFTKGANPGTFAPNVS